MALVFPDVRTVEGAIEAGAMRSTYWVFHKLRETLDRTRFMQERFPNLPLNSFRALMNRMRSAYQQGLAASRTGDIPTLGQLQFDPTHTMEGRIAYNVEVTIRGWDGPARAGRPRNIATRYTTIFAESNLTAEQLEEHIDRFINEVTQQSHYNPAIDPGQTRAGYSWQLISATRSF